MSVNQEARNLYFKCVRCWVQGQLFYRIGNFVLDFFITNRAMKPVYQTDLKAKFYNYIVNKPTYSEKSVWFVFEDVRDIVSCSSVK